MPDTPTLHNLFNNTRVKGVNFWCASHACGLRDPEKTGILAIDFGPDETLPGLERDAHCRACGGSVQVKPSWGEGGVNFFEGL